MLQVTDRLCPNPRHIHLEKEQEVYTMYSLEELRKVIGQGFLQPGYAQGFGILAIAMIQLNNYEKERIMEDIQIEELIKKYTKKDEKVKE